MSSILDESQIVSHRNSFEFNSRISHCQLKRRLRPIRIGCVTDVHLLLPQRDADGSEEIRIPCIQARFVITGLLRSKKLPQFSLNLAKTPER